MRSSNVTMSAIEPLEARRLLSSAIVKDIGPGPLHSAPTEFVVADGLMYFRVAHHYGTGGDSIAQWRMYRSDGTPDGTVPFNVEPELQPGSTFAVGQGSNTWYGLRDLVVANNKVYCLEIKHTSSMVFDVWMRSFGPGDATTRAYVGNYNRSLPHRVPFGKPIVSDDDGQVYFFWEGRYVSSSNTFPDAQWLKVDSRGVPQPTGITNTFSITGAAPANAKSARYNGTIYYAYDDGTHGLELGVRTGVRASLTRSIMSPASAHNKTSVGSSNDRTLLAEVLGTDTPIT